MKTRLFKPISKKSFFLFGPRGTGKTTWLRAQYPDSAYIDLLEDEIFNKLLTHPQYLLDLIPKEKKALPIVIDEVQKVPAILDEVHRLIEKEKLTFILTGSSARKLRKKGVNLLAGRALTYQMYPLTAAELGDDFNLGHALKHGTLPALLLEPSPDAYLQSYVRTYLKEEVQQEGLSRNLSAFSRFLEAASFSQAAPLVITNVAADAQINRKVVEDYFSILEDLLIATRLSIFSKRAKRELLHKNKFFFFDAGVYGVLRPRGPLDSNKEVSGAALETLVFQELRALNDYLTLNYEMHYWMTKSKHEVDFILYGERGLIAIEVKSSTRVRKEDLEAIKLFIEDYPMAKAYFIYGGNHRYHEAGIEFVPINDFFKAAKNILLN